MPATTNPASERPAQAAETTVWRFRFAGDDGSSSAVYHRFIAPAPILAIREAGQDLNSAPNWPAPVDQLDIAFLFDSFAAGQNLKSWIGKPDHPQAVNTVAVDIESAKLRWRPGRAVLFGSPEDSADLVGALVQFSLFEGELRRLESALLPYQQSADTDVKLSYNIRASDQSQWDRLYKTMEHLYSLRLQFARLEPCLYQSPRTLSGQGRSVFEKLRVRADIDARLEALNDQLETIEDLYEGAIDRITDYRNYRKGSLLEIAIVILLALEVALLLWHR
jgi:hypothetical protein